MKLTREEALIYHRQLWSDMMEVLGDNPPEWSRMSFKSDWCKKHFPDEHITNNCFLCEYAFKHNLDVTHACDLYCPIKWKRRNCMSGLIYYGNMPIPELLALPEREIKEE